MDNKTIFLSYAHRDNVQADIIDRHFLNNGIMLQRDIREVNYGDSFFEFMNRIRTTDFVMMLISKSYLYSINCMYELIQVMKDENYKIRIHPIILESELIYNIEGHIEIITYWENKFEITNDKISNLDITSAEHLVGELKKLRYIKDEIGNFLSFIQFRKFATLEDHINSSFSEIFKAIGFDVNIVESSEIQYSTKPFSIIKLEDISHGLTKRYAAKILLNENVSKTELKTIITKSTDEVRNSSYYRNENLRRHFGDKPADVVWLYVARDMQDISMSNWICRSQWISDELDQKKQPFNLYGDEIYNEIEIKWTDNYSSLKAYFNKNSASKEEILNEIDEILPQLKSYAKGLENIFIRYQSDDSVLDELRTYVQENENKADKLYFRYTDLPIPPFELEDYTRACDSLVGTINNMFIYYSDKGMQTWKAENRNWLLSKDFETYKKDIIKVEFESEKVRK